MLKNLYKKLPVSVRRHTSQLYHRARTHVFSRAAPLVPIKMGAPAPQHQPYFELIQARAYRTFIGRHVAVAGVFSNGTGLSKAAELVALTLESQGMKVTRVDVWSSFGLKSTNPDARCIVPVQCYSLDISDVVFVTNPETPSLRVFDRAWLLGRTIIGHWIWELETVPEYWRIDSASFDEIWTSTALLRDSIADGLPGFNRPLKVVPFAIDRLRSPEIATRHRDEVRSRESIPPNCFVVGYSFATESNYYRKNPEDAVRAFFKAFSHSQDALLLIRSYDLGNRLTEKASLLKAIGGDRRVRIYDSENRISISDFYAAIDTYLSPSRAEGYGLNLVEASQSGIPVITSGWRIAPEILSMPQVHSIGFQLEPVNDPQGNYNNIRGAVWSRPDLDEAALLLNKLKADFHGPSLAASILAR